MYACPKPRSTHKTLLFMVCIAATSQNQDHIVWGAVQTKAGPCPKQPADALPRLLFFQLLNSTWVLPMFQIGSESHQASFRNFWHPNWMPDQKTQTQCRNLSSEFASFAVPQGSWLYLKALVNSSFTPHWHHSVTGAPQTAQGCTPIWIPTRDYLCHITMHDQCQKANFHVMK